MQELTQSAAAAQELIDDGASVRMAALYIAHAYDLTGPETQALVLSLILPRMGVLV